MAIKTQASFASGELDPALHERTTMEKYRSSLANARNVIIGKTGRIVSRHAKKYKFRPKFKNLPVKLHPMSYRGEFLEWGNQYVRVYGFDGTLKYERAHTIASADIMSLRFTDLSMGVLVTSTKSTVAPRLYVFGTPPFVTSSFFGVPPAPTSTYERAGSDGTGHDVEYAITVMVGGEESLLRRQDPLVSQLPITSSTKNYIRAIITESNYPGLSTTPGLLSEARFYRRPTNGGAFGYLGSSTVIAPDVSPGIRLADFTDWGQDVDYNKNPPNPNPTLQNLAQTNPSTVGLGPAATTYQDRLIIVMRDGLEASRTNFPLNFYRDYPYSDSSSLSFGTSKGKPSKIYWLIDSDGLVVFRSDGVYLHLGALTPTNLKLEKRGAWVIDPDVPPIAIPGGVLFVDSLTNTVRQLLWSQEQGTYLAEEVSIFSNHLFEKRRIISWAFQEGNFPLLHVIFSDGEGACFTYENEHKMKAWTRIDTRFGYESVVSSVTYVNPTTGERIPGQMFFVTFDENGDRCIEVLVPRYPTVEEIALNPEYDKWETIAAIDSMTSWKRMILDELTNDTMTMTPVVDPDPTSEYMTGTIGIAITDDAIFKSTSLGEVGAVYRWFNPEDRTSIDLEVTARTNDNQIYVSISEPFPRKYAINPRLYLTVDSLDINTIYNLKSNINGFKIDDNLTVAAVSPGVWNGPLTVSVVNDAAFYFISVGDVLYYKRTDGTGIALTVTAKASDNSMTVMPSDTYPSGDVTNPPIFYINEFNLSHLEQEYVSIVADGYIISSPNNNIENYPQVQVFNGAVIMPDYRKVAIVHIGRPYTADVETLDIDTVEQRPVMIESKTVNKLYVKTYNSRGPYVGSRFPADDKLEGSDVTGTNMVMTQGLDSYEANYEEENPIIGNRYDQPTSKRHEMMLTGDWNTNGKMCFRQVDPLHWELLSIIPDMDDQRR